MTTATPSFQFITTEDGSPSLRLGVGDGTSEAMHSLKGAFSETFYIYGAALEAAIENGFPLRVLSMGLGLGYVELLAAGLAARSDAPFGGESFEIVPELREWFLAWVMGRDVPSEFKRTYDDIEARTSKHLGLAEGKSRENLRSALSWGTWKVREEMSAATAFEAPFTVICFDAFSSKSTPDLWSEDFLSAFLKKAAAAVCVLSTYACTGALKRTLRGAGFDLRIREGFSSKRDSTFAIRGVSN